MVVGVTCKQPLAYHYSADRAVFRLWNRLCSSGCGLRYSARRKTIVAWIKKKTGPPAVTAVSVADVEKVASDGPVLVLGYFEKFEVRQCSEC